MNALKRHAVPALLCLFLLASNAGLAQDATPASAAPVEQPARALPEWVVLVLQPLPGKRARPVSGVVVSEEGLIIVPMEFVSPGDQAIVLDGGTDIIENGRAVTILSQDAEAGLTLLSAPKLRRRPPSLSSQSLQPGEILHLAAFPPAEQIAQGSQPLWKETQIADDSTGSVPVLSADKLPPNVTGPLLDACGNLVGFNAATGVQSMDTTPQPRYLWKPGLVAALNRISVSLPERSCSAEAGSEAEAAELAEAPDDSGSMIGETTGVLEPSETEAEFEIDGGNVKTAAGTAVESSGENSMWRWLALLLTALLLVSGGLNWKHRRKATAKPETLLKDNDITPARPGQALAEKPAPTDCSLHINGRLSGGAPFEASCEVSSAAIDVTIGRGETDIVIDSPDVQREHVRLGGSSCMMTLTDLGSARGTWINRIPCLKGEIMYISPDDLITLGDVSFRVSTSDQATEG